MDQDTSVALTGVSHARHKHGTDGWITHGWIKTQTHGTDLKYLLSESSNSNGDFWGTGGKI
eukprot:1159496-Pelagomonas_calceolata.AAC.3